MLARKRGAGSSSWVRVSQAAAVQEGESPPCVPAARGEAAFLLLFLPHLSAQQGSQLGPGLAGRSGEAGAGGVLATVTTRAPLSVGILVTLALLHRHPATPLLDAVSVLRKENCPRCSSPGCARAGFLGAASQVPGAALAAPCSLGALGSGGAGAGGRGQAALGAARRLRGCRQVAGAMKSSLMDGGGRGFVQRAEQAPRCEIPASSQELVTISKQFPVRVLSSESP